MEMYFFPIHVAIITFIGIAKLAVIPFLAWQYRKYGAVSLFKTGILFSFVLYLLSAYYLVILPLPDPATITPYATITQFMSLVPFRFLLDFIHQTSFRPANIHTFLPALLEPVFFQPFFNLLLTIPFGIFLSYYFKQNLKKTLLFSFLLSLFFELTQLSALYGIYASPYRVFDVDDLLLNTLGGLVGYGLFKKFLFFLPSRDKIEESTARRSAHVGYIRRFVAFIIDYTIVQLIASPLISLVARQNAISITLLHAVLFPLLLLIYFMLLQCFCNASLGQKVVNLRLKTLKNNNLLAFFIRYSLLVSIILAFSLLSFFVETIYYNGIYGFIYACLVLALIIDFFISLKRGRLLFFERLSETMLVATK